MLKYISVASMVGTLMIVVVHSVGSYWLAVEYMTQHETRASVTLARVLANTLWPKYAGFVQDALEFPPDGLKRHPTIRSMRHDVLSMMQGTNVVKMKLYHPEGLTVFSTDAGQIGEDKHDNPGIGAALAGTAASELAFRGTFSAFEQVIVNRNLLSVYVPIREIKDGAPVAVLEIYSDVTELLVEIRRTQRVVVVLLLASLTLLCGFMILCVLREGPHDSLPGDELSPRTDKGDRTVPETAIADALPSAPVGERSSLVRRVSGGDSPGGAVPGFVPIDREAACAGEASSPESVIDFDALDRLRGLDLPGRPSAYEKLIAMYLERAPRLLEDLREAVRQADTGRARNAAHKLKSSSADLGAVLVASFCQRIETNASRGAFDDSETVLRRLDIEVGRAVHALSKQQME